MDRRSDNSSMWAIKLPSELSGDEAQEKLAQIAAEHGCRVLGRVANLKDYFLIEHDPNHSRKRSIEGSLQDHPDVEWAGFQHARFQQKRLPAITDPLYASQWHLHNSAGVDLSVVPAWEAGYSGRGVGVSIVDDGLEWRHGDLGEARYMRAASHDWNGKDDDPSPASYDDTHGTSSHFWSHDRRHAGALSYHTDENFVFSASWGPTDDGLRKEGPGTLLLAAMTEAITNGRNGKGTIYVWAGGNGGARDNVNYDGYANSIYTVTIASVDSNGRHASYSEEGACIIASSPSSPPGISTTAVRGNCNTRFGGTSAAAPMISGVVALMLEANPNLGWRDVQDILIRTARKNDATDPGWVNNGAGLHVNHKYGFGLVSASAAVVRAADRSRALLPPNVAPFVSTNQALPALDIPDNSPTGVTVTFTVDHLRVVLVSPVGTRSVLAVPHGDTHAHYTGWTFTSVRHWGENPMGVWKLILSDETANNVGQFNRAILTVRGH
ncbi:peptidase, S8/S53 subfamily protein [Acanthamoeba castellanii str. Neff]|uniref:Peptidase, S8/S53 subfamily protein n=1 Tax=Acanthamoeba castellanii (strain ATCC 30010 / Neff) TaxID=1257118 RepID=L8GG58_ACACF|nr:peptidase, S8/S53 subfamily protein [Acanthamoeba castellanii str. Neff]ELR11151.1 peptidase, S8/S53 subfamily protein [Acanthamoeba castellanii str. Neff]